MMGEGKKTCRTRLLKLLGFSRKEEPIVYVCVYFKELADPIVRGGKSEICKTGWRAGDSGKS